MPTALRGEYDFLQVIQGIGLIGKSVKTELEARLKLRNACGHPNELTLGEMMVASHIESLVSNAYNKFA